MSQQADLIADLEASLIREREFNASGRHINAEYLVNVLKKVRFLPVVYFYYDRSVY